MVAVYTSWWGCSLLFRMHVDDSVYALLIALEGCLAVSMQWFHVAKQAERLQGMTRFREILTGDILWLQLRLTAVVHVKLLKDFTSVFVDISSDDTVASLKQRIAQQLRLRAPTFYLHFGRKRLQDSDWLLHVFWLHFGSGYFVLVMHEYTITVKCLGNMKKVPIRVDACTPIREVKEQAMQHFVNKGYVFSAAPTFIFGRRKLSDSETVDDCNVHAGDTIHMTGPDQ